MYEIEKTLLYTYPHLTRFVYDEKCCKDIVIALSYKNGIEKTISKVALHNQNIKACLKYKKLLDRFIKDFTEEDMIIAEYKFFRRKKIIKQKYGKEFVYPRSPNHYKFGIRNICKRLKKYLANNNIRSTEILEDFSYLEEVQNCYKNVVSGKDNRMRRHGYSFILR